MRSPRYHRPCTHQPCGINLRMLSTMHKRVTARAFSSCTTVITNGKQMAPTAMNLRHSMPFIALMTRAPPQSNKRMSSFLHSRKQHHACGPDSPADTDVCSGLQSLIHASKSPGPIVVVGTTGDAATPLASSRKMAAALEDGRLLVVTANRHTGYGENNCVTESVDNYLFTTKVTFREKAC